MAPGRRWTPLALVPETETDAHGTEVLPKRVRSLIALDRQLEYRLVFDATHQLWRIDVRVHAEGG